MVSFTGFITTLLQLEISKVLFWLNRVWPVYINAGYLSVALNFSISINLSISDLEFTGSFVIIFPCSQLIDHFLDLF